MLLLPLIASVMFTTSMEDQSWDIPIHAVAKNDLATLSPEVMDRKWMLDKYFGTIAVINLPQAVERREGILKQFELIGTKNFEIFTAVDGRTELPKEVWNKFFRNRDKIDTTTEEGQQALDRVHQGEAGCYMSHYRLIKKVKESFDNALSELKKAQASHQAYKDVALLAKCERRVRQYSRVLILEDDTGFGIVNKARTKATTEGAGQILRKALSKLPKDWDMLYLVVQPIYPPIAVGPHLCRLSDSWSMVAYAVNYRMYGPLIEILEKIEKPSVKKVYPVDKEVAFRHSSFNVYAVVPSLVYQQTGPSCISDHSSEKLWQGQPMR